MAPGADQSFDNLIEGCKNQDSHYQKLLYQQFYGYAMSICIRYAYSEEEAIEILNDAFLKIFKKVHLYDKSKPFKSWLRRIMINTAIDHYRKNQVHYNKQDLNEATHHTVEAEAVTDITYHELMNLVQKLSPGYRAVFNMYVVDGYNHEEIAEKLGISVGSSKSNLSRAREHLKKMVKQLYNDEQKSDIRSGI